MMIFFKKLHEKLDLIIQDNKKLKEEMLCHLTQMHEIISFLEIDEIKKALEKTESNVLITNQMILELKGVVSMARAAIAERKALNSLEK